MVVLEARGESQGALSARARSGGNKAAIENGITHPLVHKHVVDLVPFHNAGAQLSLVSRVPEVIAVGQSLRQFFARREGMGMLMRATDRCHITAPDR